MGDEIYTIGICGAYVVAELMMAKTQPSASVKVVGCRNEGALTSLGF